MKAAIHQVLYYRGGPYHGMIEIDHPCFSTHLPCEPESLYLGRCGGGVYVITNGGATYNRVNDPDSAVVVYEWDENAKYGRVFPSDWFVRCVAERLTCPIGLMPPGAGRNMFTLDPMVEEELRKLILPATPAGSCPASPSLRCAAAVPSPRGVG